MEQNKRNWSIDEIYSLYHSPLFELMTRSNAIHIQNHDRQEIQVCVLISIKTGGCPEDCKYCAQSSRYKTSVPSQPLMEKDEVLRQAKKAIDQGATRICLGAAWREVRDSKQFDQVLDMIKAITALGAEVCCTLGMLQEHQARRLKEAGLYAYNHNLDTSEKFYKSIITTRTYQDRLDTLDCVANAGISVCCGAILGLGETILDRLEFLHTLSQLDPYPESVPINRLVPIPGTPLEHQAETSIWDLIRMIATSRIVLPKAMIRLSAGRLAMSYEQHALCFLAGANSVHASERLLTLPNTPLDKDQAMFELFNLKRRPAFEGGHAP